MITSQPQSVSCCAGSVLLCPGGKTMARTTHTKVPWAHFPSVVTSTAWTPKTMSQKQTWQLTRPEKICFTWLYLLKPSPDQNDRGEGSVSNKWARGTKKGLCAPAQSFFSTRFLISITRHLQYCLSWQPATGPTSHSPSPLLQIKRQRTFGGDTCISCRLQLHGCSRFKPGSISLTEVEGSGAQQANTEISPYMVGRVWEALALVMETLHTLLQVVSAQLTSAVYSVPG